MKLFVIYSQRVANLLIDQGFELIKTVKNYRYGWGKFKCFYFEDSEEFRYSMYLCIEMIRVNKVDKIKLIPATPVLYGEDAKEVIKEINDVNSKLTKESRDCLREDYRKLFNDIEVR